MRIKFVAPDPRAGLVAQMDSHRGQQLVDAGAAVRVKNGGSEDEAAAAPAANTASAAAPAPTSAPAPAAPKKKKA